MTAEHERLAAEERREADWKRWGPYLSERQWATVREDYSANGDSWRYFPHEHSRSRAYRWGEDGLLGITDRQCRLCFSFALWNGADPILKERLFGLTGPEGNHGEDVKECYYYLDAVPTYSYAKALYKYPQTAFPYEELIAENARRDYGEREFELTDTGIFDENRYFDVVAEYAKAGPDDILIRLTVHNRGPDPASIDILPTLWFRNTWEWDCDHEGCSTRPFITQTPEGDFLASHEGVSLEPHRDLGRYRLSQRTDEGDGERLFTNNTTNRELLFNQPSETPWRKDAFHRYVIEGETEAINPHGNGTKAAFRFSRTIEPGGSAVVELRLRPDGNSEAGSVGDDFERIFVQRMAEAEEFHASIGPDPSKHSQDAAIARQARAGLLWSNQFYHYVVKDWQKGDPGSPPPPADRLEVRNRDWKNLYARDILSMPDKWEYPWFAAWDTAFHMIPYAQMDPAFAKKQLLLFLREWYLHPNGQIPAYEFNFSDVNPPVHAWAARRVFEVEAAGGNGDRLFLERVFQKLLLNFNWWVNRKDTDGENLFAGGFLGLDNIGVFDRSHPQMIEGKLEQADATAWMAFYCLNMLEISIILACEPDGTVNTAYEDMASKFFEHFVQIVEAINHLGGSGLWDEEDGFYYDQISYVDGKSHRLKTRSLVGLLPLIAAMPLSTETLDRLPGFKSRFEWFLRYHKDLSRHVAQKPGQDHTGYLLAMAPPNRLQRILNYLTDEDEFLSPHGIRSLSRRYESEPFRFTVGDETLSVGYLPSESDSGLFGGNSNWRGPIWFSTSFLLIEALLRYDDYYEDEVMATVAGNDSPVRLKALAIQVASRMADLFRPGPDGARPCHGGHRPYAEDPHWKDLILFYEYFDPESGRGCGASHQTGWTSLVATLLRKLHENS
tara:strand:+ start:1478 stop:4165 length:2688 start_codon:yes stop_codon:yes gene_type:complete